MTFVDVKRCSECGYTIESGDHSKRCSQEVTPRAENDGYTCGECGKPISASGGPYCAQCEGTSDEGSK